MPTPSPAICHAWNPLFAPEATAVLAPLRGGAQACRLLCSDGKSYATKFLSNQQSNKILANEWIASAVATYLGITTPPQTPVWISDEFIAANNLGIRLGTRTELITAGYHLGSLWAASEGQPLYDYLPSALMSRVANKAQFIGALALDKLLHNADARQGVFTPTAGCFMTHFIDWGYCFNGPNWELVSSDACGIFYASDAYIDLRSTADFAPWITAINNMPAGLLDAAAATMPDSWFTPAEHSTLRQLLKATYTSRKSLLPRLESVCDKRPHYFPNWNATNYLTAQAA